MQVNCRKCSRPISVTDVIQSSNGRLQHLDCPRSGGLTFEERALLFVYCSEHAVARCLSCDRDFRMAPLPICSTAGRTYAHDAEPISLKMCAGISLPA
jgi:hypothetical protein